MNEILIINEDILTNVQPLQVNNNPQVKPLQVNKSLQTNIRPYVRSKGTMCKVKTRDRGCSPVEFISPEDEENLNLRNVSNIDKCSPLMGKAKNVTVKKDTFLSLSNDSESTSYTFNANSDEYNESVQGESEFSFSSGQLSDMKNEHFKEMRRTALKVTNFLIENDPKRYLNIYKEWLWIIDILQRATSIPADHIKLTLMKIKLNDSMVRLSDQFNMSVSTVSRVFNGTVFHLANMLETLIYFPEVSKIQENLPIAFRANYSRVVCILDAFEIFIQKRSDPLQQSLTWSNYKHSNTLKYVVGITPDGLIAFVSPGYGGRISDTELVKDCGLIDKLPEGYIVLADRGFKGIETLLSEKKCTLLRPPSVYSSVKPSKEEVLETKRIASIRIHIERFIERIREFEMLSPYSCLPPSTMLYIDQVTKIAAGLINLQKPLIQKH